jgi:hypothetical protein
LDTDALQVSQRSKAGWYEPFSARIRGVLRSALARGTTGIAVLGKQFRIGHHIGGIRGHEVDAESDEFSAHGSEWQDREPISVVHVQFEKGRFIALEGVAVVKSLAEDRLDRIRVDQSVGLDFDGAPTAGAFWSGLCRPVVMVPEVDRDSTEQIGMPIRPDFGIQSQSVPCIDPNGPVAGPRLDEGVGSGAEDLHEFPGALAEGNEMALVGHAAVVDHPVGRGFRGLP